MSLDYWKSAVKFEGTCTCITTGKIVNFSGKTVVILMIFIVISVDSSGNTTKFYTDFHWYTIDIQLETTGNTTDISLENTGIPLVIPPNFATDFHWYTTDIPLVYHRKPLVIPPNFKADLHWHTTDIPLVYRWNTKVYC